MAALMSVADNLTSPEPVPQPPNNPSPTSRSPPTTATTAQQRSASRGSQHSPNSSGHYISVLFIYLSTYLHLHLIYLLDMVIHVYMAYICVLSDLLMNRLQKEFFKLNRASRKRLQCNEGVK